MKINKRKIGIGIEIAVVVIAVTWVGLKIYLNRPLPPIVVPPAPRMPADNAFDDCLRAASMLQNADTARRLVPAKSPGEAQGLLRRNRDALVIVRRSVDKQFVTPRPEHWDDKFAYLDSFRQIGDLFRVEGDLRASHGDYEGAAVNFVDARRFGAVVPRGGWLIHWASGLYVSSRGYLGLEKISGKLNADTCRFVLRELQAADLREPTFAEAVTGDEIGVLMCLRDLQQGKQKGPNGKVMHPLPPMIDRFMSRGKTTVEEYQHYTSRYRVESSKPFYLRKSPAEPRGVISFIVSPPAELLTKKSIASTRAQIVKLMIALRLYRLDHGKFPGSLADLQSFAGIIDEFTGESLIYKPSRDSYVLYSVGPDGKDDGGKPIDKGNHGDIVAGKLYTR